MKMLEDELNKAIDTFNKRAETDEKLQSEIRGKTRSVLIELTDAESLHFPLKDSHLGPLSKGKIDAPDIHLTTDSATMEAILKKEMGPMKALVTKKLKLTKISMEDLNTLRKFF
jgi:putative sterol carrier protein